MLHGKLVYLRGIEIEDLENIRNWRSDPIISESFSPSFPISRLEQEKWFERLITDRTKKKLIVVDKNSNTSIGLISAMKIDHINKNCEVGWTIGDRSFHGKGHALDAVFVFCKFLFDQLGMNMLYGYVMESNKKALNFDKKRIGFVETGRYKHMLYANNRYLDIIIVCLSRDQLMEKMLLKGYEIN